MVSSSRTFRRLIVPDDIRAHRYRRLPEQGPKVLFFSGGSALNKISRVFKDYTHNSIHLVTPFDSGGSSARLRAEFHIPAVGDLRSRLMALADETVLGQHEVYALFTHRFSKTDSLSLLWQQLQEMVEGVHPLIETIPNPIKSLIQTQLAVTKAKMNEEFDLRGASIGNLIMAGGYLNNGQQLDPIVFLFSRLVKTLGDVKTVLDADFHLGVELEDSQIVLGQHNITGKETDQLTSPIKSIWLNKGLKDIKPINQSIADDRRVAIENADLICYPPGSFYSSLVANLLPTGVGRAICQNPNPKVYLPNLGFDPEQQGLSLTERVKRLVGVVMADVDEPCGASSTLDYLLLDEGYDYGNIDMKVLSDLNVTLVKTPLIRSKKDKYDESLVANALLSFV
ncbi:GAK system CofD-like protein [Marinomonas sp. C2222]|uniref:GAK system CofD-like protein n=1 Tax=Marinomonas sargassi TaxID=2984494 RepID=A0ABT2YPG4_9GAMM|nr:GAK system CofD-like protein [Marinomonas sargassi]MCV2401762.1 GAK system CofD-like protein [Marinomonas sargassi]